MTTRLKAVPLVHAAALSLCMASPGLFAAQGAAAESTAPAAAPDAAAVASLVSAIKKAIDALPANATRQQIEGAINFAIAQSGQPVSIVSAALAQVQAGYPSAAVQTAIASARKALANGTGGTTGTGGIAGTGTNTATLGGGPGGGGVGGATDYSAGTQ